MSKPDFEAIAQGLAGPVDCSCISCETLHREYVAHREGYRAGIEASADAVWANRFEPPYTVERRAVDWIRALAAGREGVAHTQHSGPDAQAAPDKLQKSNAGDE